MAKFKKLTKDELSTIRGPVTGKRARIRKEYRGYLRGLKEGEGGELRLEEGEKKPTIKNRLKRAATDLKVEIKFKRSSKEIVRFQVVSVEE